MNFLRALRLPQIALLWGGQVLSAMGDYFYLVAVTWLAVQTSGSGAGFVAGTGTLTSLVFGLLGGVCADRWNRRVIMISADIVCALAVTILPLLAFFGKLQFWHLVAVAALLGGLGALFDPALQASLPALTSDTRTLQATNGLMDVTRRLARLLGPGLAALLITFLPLVHLFTLDAVSFGISALIIFALGSRFAWQPVRGEGQRGMRGVRGFVQEIAGGIRQVHAHQQLRWSLVAVAVSCFVWGFAFIVGLPLLVHSDLGHSVSTYGLLIGAYGVGNVLSNLVVSNLAIKRRAFSVFLGKVVLGVGFLLLGVAPSVPFALLACALAAVGGPMGDLMVTMMLQSDLPSEQIGKAYSLRMVVENGCVSLGSLVAVPLYSIMNARLGIVLSALLLLATGVFGVLHFCRRAWRIDLEGEQFQAQEEQHVDALTQQ